MNYTEMTVEDYIFALKRGDTPVRVRVGKRTYCFSAMSWLEKWSNEIPSIWNAPVDSINIEGDCLILHVKLKNVKL